MPESKSRLVPIDKCGRECCYWRNTAECVHPEVKISIVTTTDSHYGGRVMGFEDVMRDFPEWCPLKESRQIPKDSCGCRALLREFEDYDNAIDTRPDYALFAMRVARICYKKIRACNECNTKSLLPKKLSY